LTPAEKKMRNALVVLTEAVKKHVAALDAEMKLPSDIERGKRIAKLINALELDNDAARYLTLNVDYRRDKKGQAP